VTERRSQADGPKGSGVADRRMAEVRAAVATTTNGSTGTALNSIDIDVGGTFTDFVLTLDGERTIAKAPTTPYDLSVCFMNAIEEGAAEAGLTLEELLPRIDVVRYSTTVAMNRLIERRGPRVALITTEGHEDAILIGRGPSGPTAPGWPNGATWPPSTSPNRSCPGDSSSA